MRFASAVLFLFFAVQGICCQNDGSRTITGVVTDAAGAVFPGMRLDVNGEYAGIADINGKFFLKVPDGPSTITSGEFRPEDFRVFLNITPSITDLGFLHLIASGPLVCSTSESERIVTSSVPDYPPAARATHTVGEVVVRITVGRDGIATAVEVVRGHPLLKTAAEIAAKKTVFDASEAVLRDLEITYVFLLPAETDKTLTRRTCPYRIWVTAPPSEISYSY